MLRRVDARVRNARSFGRPGIAPPIDTGSSGPLPRWHLLMLGSVWVGASAPHNPITGMTLLALAVGLLAAFLTGRSFEQSAVLSMRWLWIPFAVVFVQFGLWVTSRSADSRALFLLHVVSVAVLGVWIIVNAIIQASRSRLLTFAFLIAGVGLWMNLLVTVMNGGMPVAIHDDEDPAYGADRQVDHASTYRETDLTDETVWPWLGDFVRIPGVGQIVSAGDILLVVGLGFVAFAGTGLGPKRDSDADRSRVA